MTKHVHVHIHHRTADQEYQRDKDGKFATTGSSGGGANHHHERMTHHQSEQAKKGPQHPDHPVHGMAAAHHQRARNALEYANEAGAGRHAHHEHMAVAQLNANEAAKHEGKVKGDPSSERHAKQQRLQEIEKLDLAPNVKPEQRARLEAERKQIRAWMKANPHAGNK